MTNEDAPVLPLSIWPTREGLRVIFLDSARNFEYRLSRGQRIAMARELLNLKDG